MKRSPSAVSGKALKAFRRRKVMNLAEVAELVHSSITSPDIPLDFKGFGRVLPQIVG
jgi:hypothetical protein